MSAVCFVSRYTEPTPNNAKHSYSTALNKPHYSNLHSPIQYAALSYTIVLFKTTPYSPTLHSGDLATENDLFQ